VAAINSSLNLEDVENNFQISAAKVENGYELRLMPRAASMKRVFQKLALRINDQLRVERTDMLLPNGDRIVTTYSDQTHGLVPASMFEFTPPAAQKFRRHLGDDGNYE
jgi:outer membrane lipoprotein-sorting protein